MHLVDEILPRTDSERGESEGGESEGGKWLQEFW